MSISKFLAIHIPLSYTEGTGERGGGGGGYSVSVLGKNTKINVYYALPSLAPSPSL